MSTPFVSLWCGAYRRLAPGRRGGGLARDSLDALCEVRLDLVVVEGVVLALGIEDVDALGV